MKIEVVTPPKPEDTYTISGLTQEELRYINYMIACYHPNTPISERVRRDFLAVIGATGNGR